MFWTIAKFEAWYQLRNPVLIIWALLSTATVACLFIVEPMRPDLGQSLVATSANSFFPIFAGITLGLMVPMTGILGPAVVRDLQLGSGDLLKATLMTRSGYVTGRFFGAFSIIALIYALHIPVIWLACQWPGLPADKYPAFQIMALLQPAAIMASTLLATAGLLFAIGTITRSALVSYVLVALLIAAWVFALSKIALGGFETLRNAIDWTGVSSVIISNEVRSIHERNTQLLTLNNGFFVNRAVWLGVGLAGLGVAWLLQGVRGGLWGNRRLDSASGILAPDVGPLKPFTTQLNAAAKWTQLKARFWLDLKRIVISPAYAVLFIGGLFLVWLVANNTGQLDDRALEPVTRLLVDELMQSTGVIILIVSGVFASELVWGDTDRKIHELVDTTPTSNWAYLIPKIVVIIIAAMIFGVASVCVGMAAQAFKGFPLFEVGKLALWFIVPMAIFAFHFAVLAITCHCVVPNKFIGWGLYVALTIGIEIVTETSGWDHVLMTYGFGVDVPLSDFNGQGHFTVNSAWLDWHWTLVACTLILVCSFMWRRGTEQRLRRRLATLPNSLKSPYGAALVAFFGATLVSGGWILYNNPFMSEGASIKAQAQMERELAPLEGIPGPTVVALSIDVDIRPKAIKATAKGVMTIENRTAAPLTRMVFNASSVTLTSASMVGATRGDEIEDYGVEFWTFATPMQPGEKRDLIFETTLDGHSIAAETPETAIVSNGSFIDSRQLVPTLRIDRNNWLTDIKDRKKQGLPEKRPVPAAMLDESFYTPGSGWIDAQITISTDADQIPIAPGVLVRESKTGGRVTRIYRPPVKIQNAFSLQSGSYLIKRDTIKLNDKAIALEIFHLPGFTRNLDVMMRAMKVSLTSLTTRYGPYPFEVLRIIQTPGYGKDGYAAQALAGVVPFYEDGGWLQTGLGKGFDRMSETVAHEVAHMWWGHQITPSNRPGALLLVESLAEMSAWVVEKDYMQTAGIAEESDSLSDAKWDYATGRSKEKTAEPTLVMMEREKYLAYDKGPLALNLLRDQMGSATFDGVLKDFVASYAFADRPYPNAQDLLTRLRTKAGPSLGPLITQMFEDRVRWNSEITKFSTTGDPKLGWSISVTAAAWSEQLDPLGKQLRKAGISQAQLRTQTSAPCDPASLGHYDKATVAKIMIDCRNWTPQTSFRADFTPDQVPYRFKVTSRLQPAGVGLGYDFLTISREQNEDRTNRYVYFPSDDFLPPKPTQ
jgi:ABC-2 type transport system permease protein